MDLFKKSHLFFAKPAAFARPVTAWPALLQPATWKWSLAIFVLAAGILAWAQLPALISMIDVNRPERVLATMPGLVFGFGWVMLSVTAALQILVQLMGLVKLNRTRPALSSVSPLKGNSATDSTASAAQPSWPNALGFMICACLPFALQMIAHGLIELGGGSTNGNGLTELVSKNAQPRDALAGLMWQILWQLDLFFAAHVLIVYPALAQVFRIDKSNMLFTGFIYSSGCAVIRALAIMTLQAI